jgi:coenzyme F420-0:L-glutamate ligase/coenzyme F420-1:gamma-L-glutamate ligase
MGGDLSLLRSRRSVRHFQNRPVERELLEQVIEAATWAPSAHNRQPWRFVALTSPEARGRLSQDLGEAFRRDLLRDGLEEGEVEKQVARSRQRMLEAPAAVLLCLDETDCDVYPDERRRQAEALMGAQSVALAGGHLLLAAHAEGLGGVWICAPLFAPRVAQKALDLPDSWQPQALILLGYPAQEPKPRSRRPLEEVTKFL